MERVYKSLEDFVAKQFQLIEKERDAEVEETRAIREGLPPKVIDARIFVDDWLFRWRNWKNLASAFCD